MGEPQKQSLSPAVRGDVSGVELESLVAQLADEAEYWNAQAQRVGLAAELLDPANTDRRLGGPPRRAVAARLPMALSIWAILSFVAYALYRLLAG